MVVDLDVDSGCGRCTPECAVADFNGDGGGVGGGG